ncbi:peptide chain release factor N(5)-glutamine methyltransferase [Paracoccus laeviglucosivorans]|uniref:Release factor glutamine methyltransferase n=1 Tax=Paracoccus laeviglucosivorans TaxID=1197861 RepID=A0A521CEX8_9RHOB|nr:peptide chain release factor N(5)-glutamine methyltransferase [Paracoccus laeviglucosivorans]SMO57321.1 [protein release factor]-glutamine N5-methyltransferase [Paracoccus laeviglucosivorans]
MTTGRALCQTAEAQLAAAGVASAAGDAQVLFWHVLRQVTGQALPRHALREHLAADVAPAVAQAYAVAIAARAGRQPVSQITGRRAFWKHDFRVTADTLDPRPETELLVEAALGESFDSVLDMGTGTGAILISILSERPGIRGVATDLSPAALEVAQGNAHMIGVAAEFISSDWFSEINERFALIVSNPPYIALDEMSGLAPEVRDWEPRMALTDEGDGLAAYRAICAGAPDHLKPGGRLMVEIGPTQAHDVSDLMRGAGLTDPTVLKDLDGRDRVVWGRNPVTKGA